MYYQYNSLFFYCERSLIFQINTFLFIVNVHLATLDDRII